MNGQSLDRSNVPAYGHLFRETADGPRLLGSRCGRCSTVIFPVGRFCPKCSGQDLSEQLLARRGTLWTWTVQLFPPKPPFRGAQDFVPFGVGYVELDGRIRVEARLTERDPERLRIGMAMELVIVPVPGSSGAEAVTYAFAPVVEGSADDR